MNDDASSPPIPANKIPPGFEDALRFLCNPVSKAAYPPDLTPLKNLLSRMGNPEEAFRSVIITGSVGKGTVAHLLAAALRTAGFRTGLFSGPHLHNFRERMAIGSQPITPRMLVEEVEHLKALLGHDVGHLSTFELATALAFGWFAREGVEIAVLEVGIGGRYDAANLAPAESAILLPIELEHTVLLGDSLAQIAHHKAGVVPRDGFVVTAPQPPPALEVIQATCRKRDASLLDLSLNGTWELTANNTYRVSIGDVALSGQSRLLGTHNGLNIALALAWATEAARRGVAIAPEHLTVAARDLRMPGRVEKVDRNGVSLLIDGAHTPAGASALTQTLQSLSPSNPRTYIVGISRDKDAAGFLRALNISADATLVLTTFNGHRAMPLDKLAGIADELGLSATTSPDVGSTLKGLMADHLPANAGLIVVTGSLHLAAQTREWLGLLNDVSLAEARLTRDIFSGPQYLAQIDHSRSPESTPHRSS